MMIDGFYSAQSARKTEGKVGKWQLRLLSKPDFLPSGPDSCATDAARASATAAKTAEVRAIRRVDSL